jgi:hypothetical protein
MHLIAYLINEERLLRIAVINPFAIKMAYFGSAALAFITFTPLPTWRCALLLRAIFPTNCGEWLHEML